LISSEQREKLTVEIGNAERQINSILRELEKTIGADVLVKAMDVSKSQGGTKSTIQLIGQLSLRGAMPKPKPEPEEQQ